jgi:hypothetical protein
VEGSCEYGDEPSGSGATELGMTTQETNLVAIVIRCILY